MSLDFSNISKGIKHYYIMNELTEDQAIIVSRVQDLINIRELYNYEHIDETKLKLLLSK